MEKSHFILNDDLWIITNEFVDRIYRNLIGLICPALMAGQKVIKSCGRKKCTFAVKHRPVKSAASHS